MSRPRQFKFRSFTEQISNIKIDVVHSIRSVDIQPSEHSSFFQESLSKWKELNCSVPFYEFFSEVSPKAHSLFQVIHHKEDILKTLQNHLMRKNPLVLEPLLDMVVQLARDLQAEFYPRFLDFFHILVSICNMHELAIVEKSFNCFAYLFKFLWRHMLKDITNLYRVYSGLFLDTQKKHVKRFAVESFSFLLRKVRNLEGLCELMLLSVVDQPEMADGVGILLFEVCKGVPRRFHSFTDKILPVLLSKFSESNKFINSEAVFSSLCKMFRLMAEHTQKEFSSPMWNPLIDVLHVAIQKSDYDTDSMLCLQRLAFMMGILVSWRNGSRVTDGVLKRIREILCNITSSDSFSSVASTFLHLASSVMLLPSQCDHELDYNDILLAVFNQLDCYSDVLDFSLELYSNGFVTYFEDILPLTLAYCEKLCTMASSEGHDGLVSPVDGLVSPVDSVLTFIVKLCTPDDSESAQLSIPTVLDLSNACSTSNAIPSAVIMCEEIVRTTLLANDTDWCRVWAALKCLQHLRPYSDNTVLCCSDIFLHLKCASQSTTEDDDSISCGRRIMLLAQCMSTLACVMNTDQLMVVIDMKTLVGITESYFNSIIILESVLTCVKMFSFPRNVLSSEDFCVFLSILKTNLSSPSSKVRLVTLQILNCFPNPTLLPDPDDDPLGNDKCDIIDSCLRAEETPPTLTTYRNRLMWLSKITYSQKKFKRLPEIYKEIPLRYLLGMLYVNFSVLWDPVCELISSYACIETKTMFWEVFGEVLVNVSQVTPTALSLPVASLQPLSSFSTLQVLVEGVASNKQVLQNGRPDHVTYRMYLWKCMCQFSSLAESKSKIIVPLLYQFIENEYGLSDDLFQSTQDISASEGEAMEGTEEESRVIEECISSRDEDIRSHKGHPKHKGLNKTLISILTLMSKFTNPKGLYRQDDLKKLYMRLLMNRSSDVQSMALNCLLTYKLQYLTPYRENLEQLVDESAFQEQLLCLSYCSESSVVEESHRQSLVPILIRILYGRRQSSTSRSSKSSRRNVIMRFLGSNGQIEITEYLNLLMSPFINNPLLESGSVNPNKVIPLKVQQSFLYEISQLLKAIGDQLLPHVSSIFAIVFSLASHCAQLLSDCRCQVASNYYSLLKNIRQSALNLVSEILDRFPDADLSSCQQSLLSSLVWPQLPRLHNECSQYPTPLLKLLAVFSKHEELHHLLGSPYQPPSEATPLPVFHYIIQCLRNTKTSRTVTNAIMDIVMNLMGPAIETINDEDNSHNEGLKVLRPYLGHLLEYISEMVKQQNKPTSNGLGVEFEVLSKITLISNDAAHSDVLIELLLPFLVRSQKTLKKDAGKILKTIYNLIPMAKRLANCYRILSKMFQTLKSRNTRRILCEVYERLTEKDPSLSQTLSIIKKVNSWDPNRIEEPDYVLRQEGFMEAKQLLSLKSNGHLQTRLILPVVHNALYSVFEFDDISIRDVAGSFLSCVISEVPVEDCDAFQTLIIATIGTCLLKSFRSKNETTLNECVEILAQLVRAFPSHPKFADMTVLTDTNPEMDFFKNVRHIQLHRRTRAYRLLAQTCLNQELSQYSMTSFLLPLASHVVFTNVNEREHNMVLEAVNVIGGIARKLKWTNYCFLLKHYLRQLPKETDSHKSIIRVIVSLLDNFHYTVSEPAPADSSVVVVTPVLEDGDEEVIEPVAEDDVKGKRLAERIYVTLMKQILPMLESNLIVNCDVPAHKLSKQNDVAVSEKVRVPIAMATTKLLLQLPESSLHTKLPGLLLKVCNTLKSRLTDVREAGRDTLLKMAQSLGSKFICYIFSELTASLTRGYQLHVLSFGIHHLLHGIVSKLAPGDLDSSYQILCPVLMNDIFGSPADERQIKNLVAKTHESKTCKSVLSFGLIARFLSPGIIPKLLKQVLEMLENRTTSKVALIVEDIFKKVAIGIQRNKGFTPELMLLFVHEVLTDMIKTVKPKTSKKSVQSTSLRPLDCRLLPDTPNRSKPPRLAKQGNLCVHLVTQFGLQLFKMALRKGKFKESSPKEELEMLDPFVSILCEEVLADSRHEKLLSKALKCLIMMLHLPLPSLKMCLSDIVSNLFGILRHFSYSGSVNSSTSQELVATAFKSVTLILRDFAQSSLSDDELRLLVSYIEQDIHDYKRQSTAFPLLKAILNRRFVVEEMSDLMYKVAELSIRGDTSRVRINCRNVLLQYILNYPLGKKVNRYLDFFIANLSYEEQSGRESVIESLGLIFNKFPQKVLVENTTYFLVPIASQLINEDSSVCRQMLSEMFKILYKRITKDKRTEIVSAIRDWLSQDNMVHKRLAVQLTGHIVDIEGKEFDKRVSVFIPLLAQCLIQSRREEPEDGSDDEMEVEGGGEALKDHLLFHSLVSLEKIFTVCGINGNGHLNTLYCQIWDSIHQCLLYPHSWVRLVSSRLLGILFASANIEDIAQTLTGHDGAGRNKVWLAFFVNGGLAKIREVKHNLMGQLKSSQLSDELANQAIKNQVFIAKLLLRLHLLSPPTHSDSDNEEETDSVSVATPGQELRNLIYRMDRLSRYEAGHHPKESLKRSCVFKWIAAVAMAMGSENVSDWLYRLLPPLYKELSNPKKVGGEDLHNLAVEVVDIIKGIAGKDAFSTVYSQVHSNVKTKQLKRKAQQALDRIKIPV